MARITRSIPPQLSWSTLAICSWRAIETLHNLEYARSIVLHPALDTVLGVAGILAGILLLQRAREDAVVKAQPSPITTAAEAGRPHRSFVDDEELLIIVRRRRRTER